MPQNNDESKTQDIETVDSLKEKLEEVQAKADDNYSEYLRARADLDNTRKRSLKDVENARKFSIERFTKELLNVLDSIEQGLQTTENIQNNDANTLREGMILTQKMLLDTFQKFGVSILTVEVGQPFNPNEHQAIAAQETDEYAPNIVMSIMQCGYVLNERILRPARVVVSKASENDEKDHKHVDLKA
ncbi:MAG: nucleotide exchange factor GrpE [Francisellaceae bacterium]|jgi:molecular chaperone GrpE|nr:nucleotide exchange factor GrpE [Francisellaceae bacterium]MBT6208068.1 nucleotide exchange factor GrpE [Francisellaceae bacterium]MBT6538794.1 nucleotide exchange factor GrpE [Francisellaceae bacterium]